MASMLAATLVEKRRFELRDAPMPEVGAYDARIRVNRTGVCGTDFHIFNGHYAADRLPLIPGHEFTGVVEAVGRQVSNVKEGERVVADINIGCGECFWCRRNEVLNCPAVRQVGIGRDGAFAEFLALPARLVIAAPELLEDSVLALTEPVACVVRAARKSGVGIGNSVVVLGAGPVGNLHIQMMRLVGAAPILVLDSSESRRQRALEAGADYVASTVEALRAQVLAKTEGRGADYVIESVGSAQLYAAAFSLIRKGGHVAFFGLTVPGETVAVDIVRTVLEENSLKGSVAGMGDDMHAALALLANGRFRTAPFTGAEFPLSRIQEAFDTFAARPEALKTQIVIAGAT